MDGTPPGNASFNQQDLAKAWLALKEQFSYQNKGSKVGLVESTAIILGEADEVKIMAHHSIAADAFRDMLPEIVPFLRQQLDNGQISITIEINKETKAQTMQPYTDKEKLSALAEKYPEVEDWVRELGLSTEY